MAGARELAGETDNVCIPYTHTHTHTNTQTHMHTYSHSDFYMRILRERERETKKSHRPFCAGYFAQINPMFICLFPQMSPVISGYFPCMSPVVGGPFVENERQEQHDENATHRNTLQHTATNLWRSLRCLKSLISLHLLKSS